MGLSIKYVRLGVRTSLSNSKKILSQSAPSHCSKFRGTTNSEPFLLDSMQNNLPDDFLETCVCGRTFYQMGAFNVHRRSCKAVKKHLSGALVQAKAALSARKRRRIDLNNDQCTTFNDRDNQENLLIQPTPGASGVHDSTHPNVR